MTPSLGQGPAVCSPDTPPLAGLPQKQSLMLVGGLSAKWSRRERGRRAEGWSRPLRWAAGAQARGASQGGLGPTPGPPTWA